MKSLLLLTLSLITSTVIFAANQNASAAPAPAYNAVETASAADQKATSAAAHGLSGPVETPATVPALTPAELDAQFPLLMKAIILDEGMVPLHKGEGAQMVKSLKKRVFGDAWTLNKKITAERTRQLLLRLLLACKKGVFDDTTEDEVQSEARISECKRFIPLHVGLLKDQVYQKVIIQRANDLSQAYQAEKKERLNRKVELQKNFEAAQVGCAAARLELETFIKNTRTKLDAPLSAAEAKNRAAEIATIQFPAAEREELIPFDRIKMPYDLEMLKCGIKRRVEGYWADNIDPALRDENYTNLPYPIPFDITQLSAAQRAARETFLTQLAAVEHYLDNLPGLHSCLGTSCSRLELHVPEPHRCMNRNSIWHFHVKYGVAVDSGEHEDKVHNIVWPKGYRTHYLIKHGVMPSLEFIRYVNVKFLEINKTSALAQ